MHVEWRWSPSFLTSALVAGEWSASWPCHFNLREGAPGTNWLGGLVGPRAGLGSLVKIKISSPSLNLTATVQVVARCSTDWANWLHGLPAAMIFTEHTVSHTYKSFIKNIATFVAYGTCKINVRSCERTSLCPPFNTTIASLEYCQQCLALHLWEFRFINTNLCSNTPLYSCETSGSFMPPVALIVAGPL
jgi:hypothetical protein